MSCQFRLWLWGPRRSILSISGQNLGMILFVININDLPQSVLKSSIDIYADDTVIYFSDSSTEIIKQVLQNDLNSVEQ